MGNSDCLNEIFFDYEKKGNKYNIILKEATCSTCLTSLDEKNKVILKDVKNYEEILESLNKIIGSINEIKNEEIIALKSSLKPIFSKIYNEEEKERYLNYFENIKKLDYDKIFEITQILIKLYEKKKEIDKNDIKFFIESINRALKQININFKKKLEEIFLDIRNDENEMPLSQNTILNEDDSQIEGIKKKSFNRLSFCSQII